MVNFPSQINNLVLLLIAIQVVHNEAAKITSQTKLLSNGSSKAVTKSQEVNDAKLPINSEEGSNASGEGEVSFSTDIAERHSNARDSTQYSYFYVASWVWHIPLWFTLWFTFYVLFNVFRAIYGHHINPDDYLRRKRDIQSSPFPSLDEINRISDFAERSFEKFKNKKNI